jgi:DegV family protein with EDD domain
MENFKIITDSSCDLSKETLKNLNIDITSIYVTMDGGDTFLKDGVDIDLKSFYTKLQKDNDFFPKTSLASIQDYIEAFEKYLKEGIDIFHISISSAISGSHQSALNAAQSLREKYKDRKIIIIDSENASAGQGLIVEEAYRLKSIGFSVIETETVINKIKKNVKIAFTVGTLEYLIKGGRIGKVSGIAGNLLDIKPILAFKESELKAITKVRGTKKVIKEIVEVFTKDINYKTQNYKLKVAMTSDDSGYKGLIEAFEASNIKIESEIMYAGAVITSHVGPTAYGVTYMPLLTEDELKELK